MTETTEELTEEALKALKEFGVIKDMLLVPLKEDIPNQRLPLRRRWRGGCLLRLPDLVPVNPEAEQGERGFCEKVKKGSKDHLKVTVKNQGDADAPASVTRVIFPYVKLSYELPTQPIPAGESIVLDGPEIKADCFDSEGDCEFQIIVDAENKVDELSKDNNTAFGTCLAENPQEG